MSALREAAQQALEALNSIDVGYRSPSGTPLEASFDEGKCEAAITALRAALAQQDEPVEPVAWRLWDEDPQGGGDWRYYDAKDFKEGIDPMKYFDGLVPLYLTPPRCPNCASLEAQNTELDRKLAELEQAYENGYKAGEANEREACAKVCERHELARSAAAAIRARGNT